MSKFYRFLCVTLITCGITGYSYQAVASATGGGSSERGEPAAEKEGKRAPLSAEGWDRLKDDNLVGIGKYMEDDAESLLALSIKSSPGHARDELLKLFSKSSLTEEELIKRLTKVYRLTEDPGIKAKLLQKFFRLENEQNTKGLFSIIDFYKGARYLPKEQMLKGEHLPILIRHATPDQIKNWAVIRQAQYIEITALSEEIIGALNKAYDNGDLVNLRGIRLKGRPSIDRLTQLLSAPFCSQLTHLIFESCEIGDEGAAVLARSEHLRNLSSLGLEYNKIGAAGIAVLARSENLINLSSLNLEGNEIGDEGAAVLARSENLRNLSSLNLGQNGIGAEGAAALARSENLINLTFLGLWHNGIGDAGAAALARSENLRNLTSLMLSWNGIGAAGARAIAISEHLKNLTSLRLGFNRIGDAGAAAFVRSEYLKKLTSLNLLDNGIYFDTKRILRERFPFASL
jgi:Leucine-rich repeat (LRR) protein